MHKEDFFMAILLFLYLIITVSGFVFSMYGICAAAEIWLRLLCWFGSIVSLIGTGLIVWLIKTLYFFDKE